MNLYTVEWALWIASEGQETTHESRVKSYSEHYHFHSHEEHDCIHLFQYIAKCPIRFQYIHDKSQERLSNRPQNI